MEWEGIFKAFSGRCFGSGFAFWSTEVDVDFLLGICWLAVSEQVPPTPPTPQRSHPSDELPLLICLHVGPLDYLAKLYNSRR